MTAPVAVWYASPSGHGAVGASRMREAAAPSAAPAVTRHPLAVTPLSNPAASKNNDVVTKFTKSSTSR